MNQHLIPMMAAVACVLIASCWSSSEPGNNALSTRVLVNDLGLERGSSKTVEIGFSAGEGVKRISNVECAVPPVWPESVCVYSLAGCASPPPPDFPMRVDRVQQSTVDGIVSVPAGWQGQELAMHCSVTYDFDRTLGKTTEYELNRRTTTIAYRPESEVSSSFDLRFGIDSHAMFLLKRIVGWVMRGGIVVLVCGLSIFAVRRAIEDSETTAWERIRNVAGAMVLAALAFFLGLLLIPQAACGLSILTLGPQAAAPFLPLGVLWASAVVAGAVWAAVRFARGRW